MSTRHTGWRHASLLLLFCKFPTDMLPIYIGSEILCFQRCSIFHFFFFKKLLFELLYCTTTATIHLVFNVPPPPPPPLFLFSFSPSSCLDIRRDLSHKNRVAYLFFPLGKSRYDQNPIKSPDFITPPDFSEISSFFCYARVIFTFQNFSFFSFFFFFFFAMVFLRFLIKRILFSTYLPSPPL